MRYTCKFKEDHLKSVQIRSIFAAEPFLTPCILYTFFCMIYSSYKICNCMWLSEKSTISVSVVKPC